MASKSGFKVIIVGGGIGGLSLAKMLEKVDIDYVLLEGHSEIAPAVGASIALQANGSRILDQIDCYDAIKSACKDYCVQHSYMRTPTGKPFAKIADFREHLELRYGYPMVFMDRQWMLQAVADQIQSKDRIILNSRVEKVEQYADGISVTTTDGRTFAGDMVVGADGIRSIIKEEMRRIAAETRPGHFDPEEEDRVPCRKSCIFGISKDVERWPEGVSNFISGNGHSFLVASGPEKRCYWFLFVRLPKTLYGKDIPRYTKEDELLLAQKYLKQPLMQNLTFGEIYAKRISSTLTPLPESVMIDWCFERMVLIGDAVHKADPINGMGGNGAIETAAELVNSLIRTRKKLPRGLDGLTALRIETISREMQAAREARAKDFVKGAQKFQGLMSHDNWFVSKLIMHVVMPWMSDVSHVDALAVRYARSSWIHHLPLRHRPHAEPYDNELPAKPIKGWISVGIRSLLINGMGQFWSDSVNPNNPQNYASLYKSSQLVAPLVIYTVERYRAGNPGRFFGLRNIAIIVLQSQVVGYEQTFLLYVIANYFFEFVSYRTTGRRVKPEVAQALMPALMLGYYIPSIMLGTKATPPTSSPSVVSSSETSRWAGLNHPLLLLLYPFLTVGFSTFFRWSAPLFSPRTQRAAPNAKLDSKPNLDRYKSDDVPILQAAYGFAFLLTTLAHFNSIWNIYDGIQTSGRSSDEVIRYFLKNPDMTPLPAVLAGLCHVLYWVWDLRTYRYVTTRQTLKAALAVIAGSLVVGPAATWLAFWSWREAVIAGIPTLEWS